MWLDAEEDRVFLFKTQLWCTLAAAFYWFVENIVFFELDDVSRLANAVRRGDLEKVEELLSKGVDANSVYQHYADYFLGNDDERYSMLWLAAAKGYLPVVNKLLAAGVNPKLAGNSDWYKLAGNSDWYNCTPVHIAASNDHATVIKRLAEAGANVNLWDIFCDTPLDYALIRGNVAAVKSLIESGADIEGRSAKLFDLAIKADDAGLLRLLVTKGLNLGDSLFRLALAESIVNILMYDGDTQDFQGIDVPVLSILLKNAKFYTNIERRLIEKSQHLFGEDIVRKAQEAAELATEQGAAAADEAQGDGAAAMTELDDVVSTLLRTEGPAAAEPDDAVDVVGIDSALSDVD